MRAVLAILEKLPGPKIRPAKEGELLIVVAKFRGPESPDPQMYIARRLEADLLMHPALADKVRVSRFPAVIEEESLEAEVERARALGETYKATLVIWGEHDGHSAAPHYLVSREREKVATLVELEPRAATADLNQFVMYVSEELPETMTYLSLFTIGQMYYSAYELSQSLSLFSAALDHFPPGKAYQESAVALRLYRGNAYYNLGEYQQAIADYDKAIELRPDLAGTYHNRGIVYEYNIRGQRYGKDAQLDRAIANYDKAIKLKSDFTEAYYNRGVIYAHKGDYDLAIADFDKAIELRPDYAEAYNNRGAAYGHKGEYDQAIADCNKAIELRPDYVGAYINRGSAYCHKGEYDLAIVDFDKAIHLKPDYAKTYYNQGVAYTNKCEYDLAIIDFDRAIELRPDYAEAYNNRGAAYCEKGEYDLAVADYDRAIKLRPDFADAHYNRGLVHKKKGEKEEAIRDFERVLELSEDGYWRKEAEEHLKELRGQ